MFDSGEWIVTATIAALFAAFSSFIEYERSLNWLLDSYWAKAFTAVIVLSGYMLSQPSARFVISRYALLDPDHFPLAIQTISIFVTIIIAMIVLNTVLIISALNSFAVPARRKLFLGTNDTKIIHHLDLVGRIAGSVMLIIVTISIVFGFKYPGLMILEWTSFRMNADYYDVFSSEHDQIPDACVAEARKALAEVHSFECVVQPLLCGNVRPEGRLAYLSDDRVAVIDEIEPGAAFNDLLPFRIDIQNCDLDGRYRIIISDKGIGEIGSYRYRHNIRFPPR